MANQTILVTGAAPGSQGSTGWHIVRLLCERGLPVRAFVHTVDERSDRLRSLGAEVIQGDLLNFFVRSDTDDYVVTDAISKFGGHQPKTLAEFIGENRSAFQR